MRTATKQEAINGNSNDTVITPLRLKQVLSNVDINPGEGGGSSSSPEYTAGTGISIINKVISNTITKTSQLTNDSNFITEEEILDPVPVNSIFDYEGDTVPDGFIEVEEEQVVVEEVDPTVPAHVKAITQADIEKWNSDTGGGSSYEPNIMTIKNAGKQTWTKGTYAQLKLELLSSIGDKLTYTTNGIKIGSGVTRVKISGYATIMSSEPGPIHFKIVKNVHDNANTIGWLIDRVDVNYGQTSVTYPSSIVSVTEGDIIYMYAYTTGIGQVGADSGTVSQANLTVEVIQ